MNLKLFLLLGCTVFSNFCLAAESLIRIGVMASGTLNWELAVMQNEDLLKDQGFTLEPVLIANQQAGKVALQAGSVDMIISDWIWVSGMRSQGNDYTFYPYSASSGGLIVPANSSIKSLADLQGKRLGIAGGELDKNWSLLQALAQQQQLDLNQSVEKTFAAPPILNQQLMSSRIDALLTYWHFAARLEAQGYRQLMSGEDMIRELGFAETVPSLGYVFKQSWGEQHKTGLQQFLATARLAKDKLCTSDQVWDKITPLTETTDEVSQQKLKSRYCQGRVQQWGKSEQLAAEKIYHVLHQLSDNKLTGKNAQLQAGTFWQTD